MLLFPYAERGEVPDRLCSVVQGLGSQFEKIEENRQEAHQRHILWTPCIFWPSWLIISRFILFYGDKPGSGRFPRNAASQ